MKTKEIKLDEKTVKITKLPIVQYAELIRAVKELPAHFKDLQGKENSQLIEKLPEIIVNGLPDFIKVLTIATPLTESEIEQLGLDEITKLVMAVIEVNNYQEVYKTLKNAMTPAKA